MWHRCEIQQFGTQCSRSNRLNIDIPSFEFGRHLVPFKCVQMIQHIGVRKRRHFTSEVKLLARAHSRLLPSAPILHRGAISPPHRKQHALFKLDARSGMIQRYPAHMQCQWTCLMCNSYFYHLGHTLDQDPAGATVRCTYMYKVSSVKAWLRRTDRYGLTLGKL